MGGASIEVSVRFFGFPDEIPESRLTLVLPDEATLADVIESLASTYGHRLKERLLEKDGRLRDDVKLIIEDQVIDRLDHEIGCATTVFVVSQFAGGEGNRDPISWPDQARGTTNA